MKNSTILLILTGLLLSGILSSGCGESPESRAEAHASQRREQKQHKDQPDEHKREVHLTNKQIRSLGIKVADLSEGSAISTLARPASIGYDLDRIAKVGPRIESKVVKVLKDLGDNVQKDEPIVLMNSIDLGKIKAEYIRLRARLKAEKARFEREQSLYDQEISSHAELLDAEANYQEARAEMNAAAEALRLYGMSKEDIKNIEAGSDQPLSYFYVISPMNGVIQERHLSPGQTVSPNETPIHIADVSQMWVMINAYEQDIPLLKRGQKVSLSVRSISGKTFEATTDWVSFALEKDTRTMPVRATIDNRDGKLRAGMFGTARISTGKERSVAMIPVDAVQNIDDTNFVFVPGGKQGSFKAVPVMLGNENNGYAEIASGLQPGDKAVVTGAFDLKSALTSASRSAHH